MSRTESLEKIRIQLIKRRDALARSLRGDLRLLQEAHQEKTGDVLDAASDTISDELNSQLIQAESRELREIQDAIARWDEGTFGVCQQCEKNIPLTRLRAVPYATDCIGCRRTREQRSATAVPWNRVFDVSPEIEVA
ncbi:MAG: TraR/DksA C4-type zinc finger protein [Planctomycetota bacterium]